MDRSQYPALHANPHVIHMDASAAFPVHTRVVSAVTESMTTTAGTPSKANYDWAQQATALTQQARSHIADFVGVEARDVLLGYSASDGLSSLLNAIDSDSIDSVMYSPADHSSVIEKITTHFQKTLGMIELGYSQDGLYVIPDTVKDSHRLLIFVSHMHHMYGRLQDIVALRQRFPSAVIIVDISQSIGRIPLSVSQLGVDAAYFSGHKLGGIIGIGVTCITTKLRDILYKPISEPHTTPLPALVALHEAIQIIEEVGLASIESRLNRMTADFIALANRCVTTIIFAAGPAHSPYTCYGNGIVSFKIDGYSSIDIAMILSDHGINVRAADHCVDDSAADRDVVRISLHAYNRDDEIGRLVDVLTTL